MTCEILLSGGRICECRRAMTTTHTQSHAPALFPLPQRGVDPHFGLGRSTYYDLERRGLIRLVRVRKPGNIRGKVLLNYEATKAALLKLAEQGNSP